MRLSEILNKDEKGVVIGIYPGEGAYCMDEESKVLENLGRVFSEMDLTAKINAKQDHYLVTLENSADAEKAIKTINAQGGKYLAKLLTK